jgi:hypothetical protein
MMQISAGSSSRAGLDARPPRGGRCAQAARLPRGDGDHEGGEEPEADHHHHEDVVGFGQMPRQHVLRREDDGGRHHVEDAEAQVLFAHGRRAAVMCRLRP